MIARTLRRRVVLRTADRRMYRALQYLDCRPVIAGEAADHVIDVEPYREWHRIREESMPEKDAFGAAMVVDELHVRLFGLSLEDAPNAAMLHAACLRRCGRRLLLVGDKSVGKTTLTLHLLKAGYAFEGDENVFVERDGVIARPRACRVKDAALPHLAEMADAIRSAPSFSAPMGQTIFNVDPRLVGGEWRIESGPVDVVVVLQPNHGGFSSIRPMPPLLLARTIMEQLSVPRGGRGPSVAALAALVRRARGFDLSLGDLTGAVRCIDRLFA